MTTVLAMAKSLPMQFSTVSETHGICFIVSRIHCPSPMLSGDGLTLIDVWCVFRTFHHSLLLSKYAMFGIFSLCQFSSSWRMMSYNLTPSPWCCVINEMKIFCMILRSKNSCRKCEIIIDRLKQQKSYIVPNDVFAMEKIVYMYSVQCHFDMSHTGTFSSVFDSHRYTDGNFRQVRLRELSSVYRWLFNHTAAYMYLLNRCVCDIFNIHIFCLISSQWTMANEFSTRILNFFHRFKYCFCAEKLNLIQIFEFNEANDWLRKAKKKIETILTE